jgi:hypothetical protein
MFAPGANFINLLGTDDYLVSRSSHFSTRRGRHSSNARNSSAGDARASTSARFSGFRNPSSTAWSNIASNGE